MALVYLGSAKASCILIGIEIEDNWDTNYAYLLMGYLTLAWRSGSYLAGGWPRLERGVEDYTGQ